jgi:hypothetical protein
MGLAPAPLARLVGLLALGALRSQLKAATKVGTASTGKTARVIGIGDAAFQIGGDCQRKLSQPERSPRETAYWALLGIVSIAGLGSSDLRQRRDR